MRIPILFEDHHVVGRGQVHLVSAHFLAKSVLQTPFHDCPDIRLTCHMYVYTLAYRQIYDGNGTLGALDGLQAPLSGLPSPETACTRADEVDEEVLGHRIYISTILRASS